MHIVCKVFKRAQSLFVAFPLSMSPMIICKASARQPKPLHCTTPPQAIFWPSEPYWDLDGPDLKPILRSLKSSIGNALLTSTILPCDLQRFVILSPVIIMPNSPVSRLCCSFSSTYMAYLLMISKPYIALPLPMANGTFKKYCYMELEMMRNRVTRELSKNISLCLGKASIVHHGYPCIA
jgi:hypothetical protein